MKFMMMETVNAQSCIAALMGGDFVIRRRSFWVLAVVLLLLAPARLSAQISITKIGESLIGNSAQTQNATTPLNLRSHQDDAIVSFNGYQYCAYYSTVGANTAQRYVTVGRRALPYGTWETIMLPDYTQTKNDSHNVISMGICEGDGTIHLAFDHHNEDLNYRISVEGLATSPQAHSWVASKFNAVQDNLPGLDKGRTTGLTYPRFFSKPNGDLQFIRRKGSAIAGKSMLYTYNQTSHLWTSHGVYLDGTLVLYKNAAGDLTKLNGYLNGVTYSGNRLHASWVWRTEGASSNNNFDFMYAYSDDHGLHWKNNADLAAGTVSSDPMTMSNSPPVKVLAYPEGTGLANQTGQAIDSAGRVHVVQRKNGKFMHLYRDTAGNWVENLTTIAGGRYKITTDQNNNVYLIGSSARIYAATPGSSFTDWALAYNGDYGDFAGDAMFDESRMKTAGILSILAAKPGSSKEIYSIDLSVSPVLPQIPVVQDVDNGDWDSPPTWDPDGIPVSTNVYTTDLNLYVNSASSPFGGESLTIFAGGQLHLRDSVNPFVVTNLILSGGEVYAGTGNNNTFTLDGNISVVSNSLFQGFWDVTGPRNLNILSQISGGTEITSMASDNSSTHTLSIGNSTNDFSGTWISQNGTLEFANAGAVGGGDIEVLDYGKLTIQGDWDAEGTLTVSDTATAAVNLGTYNWTVSSLVFGEVPVAYGTYSPTALNALGSNPVFSGSGTISVVDPSIVTMDVLNSAEFWSTATVWDNDQIPAAGFDYFVPDTGNLKSPDGASIFAGDSLTAEGGGKFQFRAKQELGQTTTVDNLIATGGTSGKSVNLAAGTGNNTVNHLGGTLENDGFTKLSGYGNATGPRNIRISSVINGTGTLHSTGTAAYPHICTIANTNNTFSGVWESHIGTLAFETSGAIGAADINVLSSGKLQITDDWITDATLTVADTATAEVDLGSNDWTVSALTFGGSSIPENTYTAAELNALGANAVFTGSGTIHVGTPLPPPVYELIAGWDIWNSGATPSANVVAANITASAVTVSDDATRPWHTTDERGASDDGTWGNHAGPPGADTSVADTDNQNLELPNAVTGGTLTFSVTNNGTVDIELNAFHADLLAFRSKAARTYELSVLAGSGITAGTVYTSGAQEIYTPNGVPPDHDSHDDVDHSLLGLADHTLGAAESVQFRLTFSGGAGDESGGHDLWVDNVGVTGAFPSVTESPVLDYSMTGGELIFNWTGSGFKVQSRTNLTEGSWFDVSGGETPPVNVIPTNTEAFYRLKQQ